MNNFIKPIALMLLLSGVSFAQEIKDGNITTDSRRYLKDQKFDGRTEGWLITGNDSLLFA